MAEASVVPETVAAEPRRSARSMFRALEVDARLLGLIGALVIIWIGFNIMSGGLFLTPRNLWNLSVQSASVGIMATGMVLIIVSRNIDLSVGSVLTFTGMTMAMLQTQWLPAGLLGQPYTWIIVLAIGLALGAAIGTLQGFIIAYLGVPSFIVTLGGLLDLGGPRLRGSVRPDDLATRRELPAARRRADRFARRDAQLGGRHPRLRRHRLQPVRQSPPAPEVRLPGPSAVGGGDAHGRQHRGRPRRDLGRQQLLLAGRARAAVRQRPEHPGRHRQPGPHRHRRRPSS